MITSNYTKKTSKCCSSHKADGLKSGAVCSATNLKHVHVELFDTSEALRLFSLLSFGS